MVTTAAFPLAVTATQSTSFATVIASMDAFLTSSLVQAINVTGIGLAVSAYLLWTIMHFWAKYRIKKLIFQLVQRDDLQLVTEFVNRDNPSNRPTLFIGQEISDQQVHSYDLILQTGATGQKTTLFNWSLYPEDNAEAFQAAESLHNQLKEKESNDKATDAREYQDLLIKICLSEKYRYYRGPFRHYKKHARESAFTGFALGLMVFAAPLLASPLSPFLIAGLLVLASFSTGLALGLATPLSRENPLPRIAISLVFFPVTLLIMAAQETERRLRKPNLKKASCCHPQLDNTGDLPLVKLTQATDSSATYSKKSIFENQGDLTLTPDNCVITYLKYEGGESAINTPENLANNTPVIIIEWLEKVEDTEGNITGYKPKFGYVYRAVLQGFWSIFSTKPMLRFAEYDHNHEDFEKLIRWGKVKSHAVAKAIAAPMLKRLREEEHQHERNPVPLENATPEPRLRKMDKILGLANIRTPFPTEDEDEICFHKPGCLVS